ncbi:MAG: DNA-binding protein [Treponemataceae bacterium]|nr:DNA-binding protein [Treponemataceae bacterium]
MKFKVIKRTNPLNEEEAKYYAKPVYGEELTVLDLAKDISDACTLHVADVEAVLTALVLKLPVYLKNGFKVQLGSFGRVKLGLSSTGEEKEADVSAANITAKRILFTPSPELKNEIDKVSFTKAV